MKNCTARPVPFKELKLAGFMLGFGLGGFFDGILLHQILQWHHLLSGIQASLFQDIRIQILADGLFHALMYLVTGLGLWMLCRNRKDFGEAGADRLLASKALIGFGVWHILDSILSHWILGIHRIRMDVENQLFWDLLWFFVFGVAFLIIGWLVGHKPHNGPGNPRRFPTAVMLVILVLIAGPVAAMPPPGVTTVIVLFQPGITHAEIFSALEAVDGRLVWNDPSGQLWAFELATGGNANELYKHKALLVSNGLFPMGCFNWSRV